MSEIFSFLILLNDGEIIDVDEIFTVEFDAQISKTFEVTDEHYGTYAHNSFAITANGSPVIEPLQVSVKLNGEVDPEDPKPYLPTTGAFNIAGVIGFTAIAVSLLIVLLSQKTKEE